MSALAIKLNVFEGPLDLLMHLIEKNKIDIYDIPIVEITEQYIAYLQELSEFDIELASQFLVMAATLMQIKSRMLLPKNTADEDEETDPRQFLIEMLIEYRKIKQVAAKLLEMKAGADKVLWRSPMFEGVCEYKIASYSLEDLLKAYINIDNSESKDVAYIRPQAFSVKDKMEDILKKLHKSNHGFLLSELFITGVKSEKIASFLGVLELLKLGLISISQSERFAPIYILKKHGDE